MKTKQKPMVSVVIPCFKVVNHIEGVLNKIGDEVSLIICVDDCCPQNSGEYIKSIITDERVVVLRHDENQGVGGASLTGFDYSLMKGAEIIVKIDGDGQMEPSLIPSMILPIIESEADYTKGNRFFYIENITEMPLIRILGNLMLSFMTKVSSGYWNLFDPTNGFLAINSVVYDRLQKEKISKNYFFETDMLFRLNILRAVVKDIPMHAQYNEEESNLSIIKNIPIFFVGHLRNTFKRIFYNYYLRDFSVGSISLPLSLMSVFFGLWYGIDRWLESLRLGIPATAGTVLLSALPIILGFLLFLLFLLEDIGKTPINPIHKRISKT
jgi:dolichol-phosphate mannosyltransferase